MKANSGEHNGPITTKPGRVPVANDELVTVRDAMRGLNRMVAQLEAGEASKFVLMQRGRMVAAVVPLHEVER